MTDSKIEVGTIVHHPKRPVWGPGRALEVGGGGQVTIYFRDLVETKAGDAVKTISTKYIDLEIAEDQSEPMLDNLPQFNNGKFQGQRKPRLSLDFAIKTFAELQPGAFGDADYIEKARAPMMDAHQMWSESLGDGQGKELLDDGKAAEAGKRLLKIESKLGRLTPQERAGLKRTLKDDQEASFLRALFAVTDGEEPDRMSYQGLIEAVDESVEKEPGTRTTNWPLLTLFPFIAHPENQIELKPAVIQKCAIRLNYDLHYAAAPNWWTYERALGMASTLLTRLEPLGAKDFIDVESFAKVIATA